MDPINRPFVALEPIHSRSFQLFVCKRGEHIEGRSGTEKTTDRRRLLHPADPNLPYVPLQLLHGIHKTLIRFVYSQ